MCLDFADALANPMKYLSEKEKRTEQLKKLEMEEGVKENGENAQVNGMYLNNCQNL